MEIFTIAGITFAVIGGATTAYNVGKLARIRRKTDPTESIHLDFSRCSKYQIERVCDITEISYSIKDEGGRHLYQVSKFKPTSNRTLGSLSHRKIACWSVFDKIQGMEVARIGSNKQTTFIEFHANVEYPGSVSNLPQDVEETRWDFLGVKEVTYTIRPKGTKQSKATSHQPQEVSNLIANLPPSIDIGHPKPSSEHFPLARYFPPLCAQIKEERSRKLIEVDRQKDWGKFQLRSDPKAGEYCWREYSAFLERISGKDMGYDEVHEQLSMMKSVPGGHRYLIYIDEEKVDLLVVLCIATSNLILSSKRNLWSRSNF
ncbi:hypothetical protein BABINDRAFT_174071, partial [Babjeviella inositovora NRRL Y-12698]